MIQAVAFLISMTFMLTAFAVSAVAQFCSFAIGSVDRSSEAGMLANPRGMTSACCGSFSSVCYVADTGHDRIVEMTIQDSLWVTKVVPVRSWGTSGTGEGEFNQPSDIEIGPDGLLYVVDSGNDRIQVFTQEGDFVRQWGSRGSADGEFQNPSYIALGDSVYVSDTGNFRVQKFTFEGAFLRGWGHQGADPAGFQEPSGITASGSESSSEVFVADRALDRIQVFDGQGNYLREWGSTGSDEFHLRAPEGLDSNPMLTVADAGNGRILTLDPYFSGFACVWDVYPEGASVVFSDMEPAYFFSTFALDRAGGRVLLFLVPDSVQPATWGQIKGRYR